MKSFFRLSLAFVIATTCYGQVDSSPVLKTGGLQEDVAVLRSAYEQLHPGLYRYNSKAEMDKDFATLSRQLDHDQSLQDAFLAFSEFAAKIRCGHTQANPFNQPKSLIETLFKSPTRLPFYFDWLDGHMIVMRDFTTDHLLPPGTEVTRINGVAASVILMRLLSVARADGANDSKRVAQLAVNGDSSYETFDLYYPMFFPQKMANDTLLIRKPMSQKVEQISVTPLTFEERIAPIKRREEQRKGGDGALFFWKYLSDGSGYLKMPTWALYDSKWNWKQWLNEHLDDAATRNASALILDLRGNEGGDDVGNEIIPHLIDQPITLSSMRRLVRYRKVPDELVPYLDTWDKSFRDWGNSAVDLPEAWPTAPTGVAYLKLARYDDDANGDIIKPASKRFHGKVFVLIDASNSSATFQFAQNIQSHHLGTLIGQPTGGSQRGINGGAFFFLRLAHSSIEMDLPLIGTFPPGPVPDAGVTPDILVKATASDIAIGHDVGLAAAMSAILK
ncbi:S41 family peptidase [Tunturiibacter empetritectus]|uniref:Tail specific protease domain-containing protein n=2 Tax=Tunturiibacter TaxID=3154218 RepID=A0A852VHJ3_9BACT|nr:S41 family peptidase [Edaphobacter lichenicola]NYF89914.1 hypothetical protein [Edaphobacter lichenicola]